mgnify:CR=1 FL=1
MLGRAAYQTPAVLADVDSLLFGDRSAIDVFEAIAGYRPYMVDQLSRGVGLHAMTRHMLGIFAGRPGARAYRRHLSENAPRPNAGLQVLEEAVALVREAAERAAA